MAPNALLIAFNGVAFSHTDVTIGTHFDLRVSWSIALRDVPGWNAEKSRASFALGCQF